MSKNLQRLQTQYEDNPLIKKGLEKIAKTRFETFMEDHENYINNDADKKAKKRIKNVRGNIENLIIDSKDMIKQTINEQKISK